MAEQPRSSDSDWHFISGPEVLGYLTLFLVLATITHLADVSIGFAVVGTLLLMSVWIITGIACEEFMDDDEETPQQGRNTATVLAKLASSAGLLVGAACMIVGIGSISLPLIGLSTVLLLVVWVLGIEGYAPRPFRERNH